MGIGSHHSTHSLKDEWLTPPNIIESLGPFDLDPCAPINRPWDTAKNHYTIKDDGLKKEWFGRVWLNPPYSHAIMWDWFDKLVSHKNGVGLLFARTETRGFFNYIWHRADSLLFIRGRLRFYINDGSLPSGNAGGPSVLVAYGEENSIRLENSNINGKFINLR